MIATSMNAGRLALGGHSPLLGWHVRVLRRVAPDGSVWETEATLQSTESPGTELFGVEVALWNDTLVVGAPPDGGRGAVYVFERVEAANGVSKWVETDEIRGGLLAEQTSFGASVDVRGDLLLVGAPYRGNDSISGRGSAFVYRRSPGDLRWVREAQLRARPGTPLDFFGRDVALGDGECFVAASGSPVRAEPSAGVVFRYVQGQAGQPPWRIESRLFASDFLAHDKFGFSIATDGEDLLVGAMGQGQRWSPGKAYLLEFD